MLGAGDVDGDPVAGERADRSKKDAGEVLDAVGAAGGLAERARLAAGGG